MDFDIISLILISIVMLLLFLAGVYYSTKITNNICKEIFMDVYGFDPEKAINAQWRINTTLKYLAFECIKTELAQNIEMSDRTTQSFYSALEKFNSAAEAARIFGFTVLSWESYKK